MRNINTKQITATLLTLIFLISAMAVIVPMPTVNAHGGAPTIDGVISEGEWDGALSIPVTSNMGTVNLLASIDYLYVLFDLVDSTDARLGQNLKGNDQTSININPTSGGPWGFPYDLIFETSADLPWNPKVNSGIIDGWNTRWFPNDAQEALPADLQSATIYSGGKRITEWKLPLASIGVSPGNTLKIGGAIEVGDGNSYVYPVGLDWADASTYAEYGYNVNNEGTGIYYPTIQNAITGASAGDSLLVNPGTYLEKVTVDVVDLTIIGIEYPIIDPDGTCFYVVEDGVTIQGFNITGAEIGIFNDNADYTTFTDNIIHDVGVGIMVYLSQDVNASANEIYNANFGILNGGSTDTTYSGNFIHDLTNDPVHQFSVGILIAPNDMETPTVFSEDVHILGNEIYNVESAAVMIMASSNVIVGAGNDIHDNMLGVMVGGYNMPGSSDIFIEGNMIHDGEVGIAMDSSYGVVMDGNEIYGCGEGISVAESGGAYVTDISGPSMLTPYEDCDSLHPQIAVDSDGNAHIVWIDERCEGYQHLFYKMVSFSGDTLIDDTDLTPEVDWIHFVRKPMVAVDPEGCVHIVFHGWDESGNSETYYTKIDPSLVLEDPEFNIGASASDEDITVIPETMISTVDGTISVAPDVAVDRFGYVHVVWRDGYCDSDNELHYLKMDGDGVILVPDTTVTDGLCAPWYCGEYRVAVDSDGNAHIVYEDYAGTSADEIFYTMVNGTDGSTLIDDTMITPDDGCRSLKPEIAVDSEDKVHVVWQDKRDGSLEIFYTKLDPSLDDQDGSAALDAVISVVDDTRLTEVGGQNSKAPDIAIDANDGVHITFYDDRDFGYHESEVYYMKLDASGSVLIPDTRLTFDGDYVEHTYTYSDYSPPAIAAYNGSAYVVYPGCEQDYGCYKVYFVQVWSGVHAAAVISGNEIHGNGVGIYALNSYGIDIHENQVYENVGAGTGMVFESCGEVAANYNNIYGNLPLGVEATGTSVNATLNWWGDASGPSGVGPGTGDAVSDNVLYEPWLTNPKDWTPPPPVIPTWPPEPYIEPVNITEVRGNADTILSLGEAVPAGDDPTLMELDYNHDGFVDIADAFDQLRNAGLLRTPSFTFDPDAASNTLMALQSVYGENLESFPSVEGRVWLLYMLGYLPYQ